MGDSELAADRRCPDTSAVVVAGDQSGAASVLGLLRSLQGPPTLVECLRESVRVAWQAVAAGRMPAGADAVAERLANQNTAKRYSSALKQLLTSICLCAPTTVDDTVTLNNIDPAWLLSALYKLGTHSANNVSDATCCVKLFPPSNHVVIDNPAVLRVIRRYNRLRHMAKHDTFFDLSILLEYLHTHPPPHPAAKGAEKLLRARLATLLRIFLCARNTDILYMDEKLTQDKNNPNVFYVWTKRKQKQFKFEPINPSENPNVCPVHHWKLYLEASRAHRGQGVAARERRVPGPGYGHVLRLPYNTEGRLFVRSEWNTSQVPNSEPLPGLPFTAYPQMGYGPLGANKLSDDVHNVMMAAGINKDYTGSSLRGAVASWLIARGMPAQAVMARADWTSMSTFLRHYCRAHTYVDWASVAFPANINDDFRDWVTSRDYSQLRPDLQGFAGAPHAALPVGGLPVADSARPSDTTTTTATSTAPANPAAPAVAVLPALASSDRRTGGEVGVGHTETKAKGAELPRDGSSAVAACKSLIKPV